MAAGSRSGNLPELELDPAFLRGGAASASQREPAGLPLLLQRPDQVDRGSRLLLLRSRARGRGVRLSVPKRIARALLTTCPQRGALGCLDRTSTPWSGDSVAFCA